MAPDPDRQRRLLRARQHRQRVLAGPRDDVECDAAAIARRDRFVEQQTRALRRDLRIDRHREHDCAITIVDDERRGDGFTGRIVEPREADAAELAELERDFFEQRTGFVIGERRLLVALGPLEA